MSELNGHVVDDRHLVRVPLGAARCPPGCANYGDELPNAILVKLIREINAGRLSVFVTKRECVAGPPSWVLPG